MKKEELLSIMKELKEEGKIKDFGKVGFMIENYKDEYGNDYVIDYGDYVTNRSFHCDNYCEICDYFNSKTQLKAFIEKVIRHQEDGYHIHNLIYELSHKEYCIDDYNKCLTRRISINQNKQEV